MILSAESPIASKDRESSSGILSSTRDAWERLSHVEPKGGIGKYETRDGYWYNLLVDANAILWKFLLSNPNDDNLRWFLEQFGKHGPQADFRLLFSDPHLFLARIERMPLRPPKLLPEDSKRLSPKDYHRIRCRVIKIHTEILLRDEKALRRYYHAILWRGVPIMAGRNYTLAGAIRRVEEGLKRQGPKERVFHLRQFLIVAIATGNMNLVQGRKISELDEAWNTWRKTWLLKDMPPGKKLVFDPDSLTWIIKAKEHKSESEKRGKMYEWPNYPQYPFPDWRGVSPPDRRLITTFAWQDVSLPWWHYREGVLAKPYQENSSPKCNKE